MTARAPLYWNGSQLQEMSASQINTFVDLAVYYYSLDPSRTLTVSGSGGNLTAITIPDYKRVLIQHPQDHILQKPPLQNLAQSQ